MSANVLVAIISTSMPHQTVSLATAAVYNALALTNKTALPVGQDLPISQNTIAV